uniref:Terpene cyclase rstn5 n=1 Tax=Aspergillus nomiae NRRL (strain ATCC 15546 / NRRL 13137 / CBS 260.88 / M93) TaxID=1509407 RepID=RSTN5_ASPN3
MLHLTPLIFLSLAMAAAVGVWGVFTWNGGFDEMDGIVASHQSTGILGLQHCPDLDRGLMSMVAFNLPVVGRNPIFPAGRRFMVQFLANVAVIPVILNTEGARAEPGSLVRYSTTWGLFSQMATSAVMCPLYGFWFVRQSGAKQTEGGTLRPLPPNKWVVPSSVLIGYGIPALLSFDPFQWGLDLQIRGILAFTLYPLCISLTARLMRKVSKKRGRSLSPEWNSTISYVAVGVVGMVSHLWYLGTGLTGYPLSGDAVSSVAGPTEVGRAAQLVLLFLQIDYVITFAAMLLLAWHELTRHQLVRSWRAAGTLAVGWLFLGPGATLAAAWALREQWLSRPRGVRGEIKQKPK